MSQIIGDVMLADPVVLVIDPPAPINLAVSAPAAVTLAIAATPAVVITAGEQGPAGPQGRDGPPGPAAGASFLTAGVALSGHRALMFAANGAAVYADPTQAGYVFAGVSLGAAAAGALVEIATEGLVSEPSWSWTPLLPVYAGPGGTLTQTVPSTGALHQVATATSPTAIFLYPNPPIILA